jgi:hypothetical protein
MDALVPCGWFVVLGSQGFSVPELPPPHAISCYQLRPGVCAREFPYAFALARNGSDMKSMGGRLMGVKVTSI